MSIACSIVCRGRRPAKQEAGYTLIELVLTIVLVGIIAAIVGTLLLQGTQALVAEDVRSNITSEARLAIERMIREIRTIRSPTDADIPSWTVSDLSFVDLDGAAIAYAVGGGTLTRNGVPLSADVSNLSFSYFQRDGITPATDASEIWTIEFAFALARNGESQAFRARVYPRNFS